MKRRTLILGSLALSASLLLSACGGSAASSQAASASSEAVASSAAASSEVSGESVQLTVFAAASLTETLNEIAEQYKTVAPNVELVFNFDSSGTLKTQIQEGADCDLFLSAAQKQMNALQDEDLINTGTRVDLLENKVVLAVPEGNPADIQSFEDLGTDPCKRIALGNGYDSFLMFNVYAQRATSPDDMEKVCNPLLHKENLKAFRYVLSLSEHPVVWAAWGAIIEKRKYLPDCLRDMLLAGEEYGAEWCCAGAISRKGHPHHPLYLRKDEKLRPFDVKAYLEQL